ncbi:MAG: hypothetical protein JNM68_07965 [Dinghuibacter sp.]|nr:hypothetical protein [Dinghuibacter sp.]
MNVRFPAHYRILSMSKICFNSYSLVPIRYEDRVEIMKWRNEQLAILRQQKKLTSYEQDKYFADEVQPLFDAEHPKNMLFSLLLNDQFIAYGGLVHINWGEMRSEISFLNETARADDIMLFKEDFSSFLKLIEQVAFGALKLRLIHSYAYNLRPYLYEVLEESGYLLDKEKKIPLRADAKEHEVVIHYKCNPV